MGSGKAAATESMSLLLQFKPWKLLLAILGGAAFFRLWGIAFGLPYDGITYDALTIEEIQEVHRALKLGVGEYSTVFGKGGLYLILFVEYAVYYGVSRIFGWVHSGREFALHVLQDRTTIYVIGRVTVALMGVATCYVAYLIARRLYDVRVAMAAALIGALSYFHSVFSAVINVDIGATLGAWLSLLAYLRYEESGKTRALVAAGVLAAVAIAFKTPGGVVIPVIIAALATAPKDSPASGHLLRKSAILVGATVTVLTIIAPEWLVSVGNIIEYNFAALIQPAYATSPDNDLVRNIKSITVMRDGWSAGYLKHLTSPYSIALTATAAFAAANACFRRHRWDLIFAGLVVVFIAVMSASDRTQPERYLLPVFPALWLLGSRGAMGFGRYGRHLPGVALSLIVVVPAYWLVRATVEKSHEDTRILAKHWIEANVPAGSRILMDGMRYRMSQSPPLNPDDATVGRKVGQAVEEGGNFGRGVSKRALSIYEQGMKLLRGPKYELVSTVHGLTVHDIDYYVQGCYDYVVTSSMISGRFASGARAADSFPQSAKFYASLRTDPRVQLLHEEVAARWGNSGPTIRVYRILNGCSPG